MAVSLLVMVLAVASVTARVKETVPREYSPVTFETVTTIDPPIYTLSLDDQDAGLACAIYTDNVRIEVKELKAQYQTKDIQQQVVGCREEIEETLYKLLKVK